MRYLDHCVCVRLNGGEVGEHLAALPGKISVGESICLVFKKEKSYNSGI